MMGAAPQRIQRRGNAAGGQDQGPGDEKGRQDGEAWVLRDDDESWFEHSTSLRLSPLCASKYQVH